MVRGMDAIAKTSALDGVGRRAGRHQAARLRAGALMGTGTGEDFGNASSAAFTSPCVAISMRLASVVDSVRFHEAIRRSVPS